MHVSTPSLTRAPQICPGTDGFSANVPLNIHTRPTFAANNSDLSASKWSRIYTRS